MSAINLFVFKCLLLCVAVNANTFTWNSNENNHDPLQWQRSSSLQSTAVCVDIPTNLTLCQGIGYTKMRLPNLLNHDTLQEVSQQATSWVPLSQLNCHPDTQLFLCSLFSPVCLDHPIPPCRSLCQSVQSSCEKVMLSYGYPWPKIVQCDQFPIDNDMCIMAQHSTPQTSVASQQSLADKDKLNPNANKHRKQHQKKNQRNKHRRYHSFAGESLPRQETVYEPQPGHLQISTQLDAQTKLRHEPQVDQVVNANVNIESNNDNVNKNKENDNNHNEQTNAHKKWNKDQRQLYDEIIKQSCDAKWIIKARIYPPNSHKLVVTVRNYQLIHGSISNKQKPLALTVNSTQLESIFGSNDGVNTQQIQARKRYFIIGQNNGTENVVTFAMQWPHKSPQLRKAIKAINKGNEMCENRNKNADINANNSESNSNSNNENSSDSSNDNKDGQQKNKRNRKEKKNRSQKERKEKK